MDIAEERAFSGSKELLEASIEKLNEKQFGNMGGNMALFPTVIVMLGEKSKQHIAHIKNTLDANWNNSRFLKYVSLVRTGGGWDCSVLVSKGKKKKEMIWEAATSNSTTDALSDAIVEMLQQDDQIFRDKSSIKMEFVMDSTEEEAESYYNLYAEAKNGLQSKDLKTLFLMIDQTPKDGKKEKSEKILQYVLKCREQEASGTVYLLSNYLSSGGLLGESEIWQNYRLVADIILIGGNKDNSRDYARNLYNGIKTASYALVPKPTDKIVSVALLKMMEELYSQEATRFSVELSEKDIRERLGILDSNALRKMEEIFKEKLSKKLPIADDLKYLPFASEKDIKEIQKVKKITTKVADAATLGAWSLFVQKKYVDKVMAYLDDKENMREIKEIICSLLHEKFHFMEILKFIPKRDSIKQLLGEELIFKGVRDTMDYKEVLHHTALYECKKCFYEKVKQILINEFEVLLDQAKNFQEIYDDCIRELKQERVVLGDEDASIERTYANEVRMFVEKHQTINSSESAFPEVFNICLSEEQLLDAFWDVYTELIREEIFVYDFERELDFRMSNMTEVNRQVYVRGELQKILSGSVRLKTLTDIMTKMSCFYLINDEADYAKHLAQTDGNGRDFMLFDLNRTDCIEQIEIYNVTKPEHLHLNGWENGYEN